MVKFLSHILDSGTPSYGARNKFNIRKKSSIEEGDIANDSYIETTVHMGTHIDMPYHFYEKGQTIEDFPEEFWVFNNVLFIDIEPLDFIIKDELIEKLQVLNDERIELIIVRTGIGNKRSDSDFAIKNYGFHPDIYDYIIENFPSVRVFGFDSISVSSFTNRELGRKAHKKFLNPKNPVLLLEDMNLEDMDEVTNIKQIIIAPMRIAKSDGLPCTVIGFFND